MCNICNGNGMVMDGGYFAAYIPCSSQSCLEQSRERAVAQLDDLNARFGITAEEMRATA